MPRLPLTRVRSRWLLAGVWLLVSLLSALSLGRLALQQAREAFETDARIVHRLLSQRAAQHDAVLATLALLQPGEDGAQGGAAQRLPAVYPQILSVLVRREADRWPAAGPRDAEAEQAWRAAEEVSRQQGRPALATVDWRGSGRFWLLMAARPASYALQMDARAMVPEAEWPIAADSPVQVALVHAGQPWVLHPGQAVDSPWQFDFSKRLAAPSQPFDVVLTGGLRWAALPWGRALLLALVWAWVLGLGAVLVGQRRARQRAEELLRLGQVARLNTLGELAAGMAHELNQPLTAVLANTQAASRLLDDDPPELETARQAMAQAIQQARRASEVLNRLRRSVERPGLAPDTRPVPLDEAVGNALYLIEPECRRLGVQPVVERDAALTVRADPVALEQIIHNLLSNALQALERVPAGQRQLCLRLDRHEGRGRLRVRDSGPGIAPELLPRLFEPFFSTREGGLGLGLSLCESLAQAMDGQLGAQAAEPRGAEFVLQLPLA